MRRGPRAAEPGSGGRPARFPPAPAGPHKPLGPARAAAAAIIRGSLPGGAAGAHPAAARRHVERSEARPRVLNQIKAAAWLPPARTHAPCARSPAAQKRSNARQRQPGRACQDTDAGPLYWAHPRSWRGRMTRAAPNVTPFLEIMVLLFFFFEDCAYNKANVPC